MKTLSLTIICVLFLTSFNLGVNSKPFKRSFVEVQHLFLTEDYESALKTYDKLPDMGPGNRNIQYLIGLCYQNIPGKRLESLDLVNTAVDKGFQGAKLIENRELDRIIRIQSSMQIIAMSSPLDMDYFIAIHGIKRIIGKDGIYRYVIGEFETPEEALTALPGIKIIGYPDAFVMNLARYKDLIDAKDLSKP